MQAFEVIVNLHGRYRGFARLRYDGTNIIISTKGEPENSEVYVAYKDKLLSTTQLLEEKNIDISKIVGIIVFQNGRVIMEGALRGNNNSLMPFKRQIEYEKSTHVRISIPAPQQTQAVYQPSQIRKNPNRQPSEALKEILEQAKEIFGEQTPIKPNTTYTSTSKPRQRNVYNPFSAIYPNSRWRIMQWRNIKYLEGIVELEGERLHIQAIPSSNVSIDYMQGLGFTKLTKADNGTLYYMKIRHMPK